jgi:hypothetical protein
MVLDPLQTRTVGLAARLAPHDGEHLLPACWLGGCGGTDRRTRRDVVVENVRGMGPAVVVDAMVQPI